MNRLPLAIVTYFKNKFEILRVETVTGGCINDCYHLETSKGDYFLKLNHAKSFPGMFSAEAKGLHLLASTNTLKIPAVFEFGEVDGISFLLIEFIDKGAVKENSILTFGQKLAALHSNSAAHFGLDHDNYIGSLPQYNGMMNSWVDFFVEKRLLPQIKIARNILPPAVITDFERLFKKLDSLFPVEKPALLHGDLWSGNYVIGKNGTVWLVDPAVYYGHREMDIAMTRLFGTFNSEFYEGYNEVFPLAKGWQQRIGLCNLYPLLVHVNLFGAGYLNQLSACLKQYA